MNTYLVTYIANDGTKRKRKVQADSSESAKTATVNELKDTSEPHVVRVVDVKQVG